MGGMNVGGVVKGGLVAGLVINVGEFILNGVVVAEAWAEVQAVLGIEQGAAEMSVYVIGGFLMGLVGVWLYAAARPRLGAGPATAVKMGLVVFALACLWPIATFMTMGLLPRSLFHVSLVWEIVEVPLAIVAGAWLYKEAEA